ncbi:RNA-binding protein [Bradyrhizobium sp. LHD-71]|uniref:RNA-binding protein n=1 Tax=Bradyrhizobium sp. LHD-71 TaxID=3072141 RepID=UPI00280EEC68|nr:RNA-binding protein [Bradyrhizobium sp. LHD-71]MDQ8731951.1 RNA-binding protein [Bradyrhizobium sp. LHD-71]
MLASVDEAHLDSGPRTAKPGTARMCALTRQVRATDELIRFVVAPSGEVTPDLKRKLPGRGLWITASRAALDAAIKRGTFHKGFKREVRLSPTLAADIERLMVSGATEALAIAAKAGQVVSGFAKVESALKRTRTGTGFPQGNTTRKPDVAALIHASDGAADGIRKLNNLISRAPLTLPDGLQADFPIITALTSAELDLALGRANVIHAALLAGPAGKTFLSRCNALARFRANAPGETANENSGSKTRAHAPDKDLGSLDG